jgi:superoxide dismutase, Fe-Mn family
MVPLFNIDLWEHAYFIDYENSREKYLREIWKIVNWKKVAERYDLAIKVLN